MSKLSKSEAAYPHSILMQEPKDMRENNIKPVIYRDNPFPKPIENVELSAK